MFNLIDHSKSSKKFPKLSHIMKFSDLVKWSFNKMEARSRA